MQTPAFAIDPTIEQCSEMGLVVSLSTFEAVQNTVPEGALTVALGYTRGGDPLACLGARHVSRFRGLEFLSFPPLDADVRDEFGRCLVSFVLLGAFRVDDALATFISDYDGATGRWQTTYRAIAGKPDDDLAADLIAERARAAAHGSTDLVAALAEAMHAARTGRYE